MPKLLIFAACEKVIIAEDDKSVSLISLLNGLSVAIAPGTQIPANAQIPLRWSVVTLWQREPRDEGKSYEQRAQLILPNSEISFSIPAEFQLSKPLQRNVVKVTGFPVSQAGQCVLKLSLREAGSDNQWREIADYPIQIEHTPES